MPTWRRTRSSSMSGELISSPNRKILPESICSSRFVQRSSVDFPEPEAPIRQTTSSAPTERSIPFNTSVVPKDLRRPSI